MTISSKREMYALQSRGLLGNHLRTWSLQSFVESNVDGSFGFRHRTHSNSPLFKRGFDRWGILNYVGKLLSSGKVVEADVVISEDTTLLDHFRALQGEVMRSLPPDSGLMLIYSGLLASSTTFTCRDEMRQNPLTELSGLRASYLLEQHLDAESMDFVNSTLSEYPDAVIEFTSFSHKVGMLGWNTVIWEVRNY